METTYMVRRFYEDPDRTAETIKTGLTLEAAQAHCRREDTSGTLPDGSRFFDGYDKEGT